MFKFITNLFSEKAEASTGGSKSSAKNRLHFVLVQDRAGLSNEEMAAFRQEMMLVVERYFEVDAEQFSIDYKREGDTSTLVINSPVLHRRKSKRVNRMEVLDGAKGSSAEDSENELSENATEAADSTNIQENASEESINTSSDCGASESCSDNPASSDSASSEASNS